MEAALPQFFDNQTNGNKPEADYEVGYGKPPKHTRWKKGQCGNPSGKKKPKPTLEEQFASVMDEKVTLANGKTMPLYMALWRNHVHRAFKSDRAFAQVMAHLEKVCNPPEKGRRSGGVLVVPAQLPLEEWMKVAEEHQRPYRTNTDLEDVPF